MRFEQLQFSGCPRNSKSMMRLPRSRQMGGRVARTYVLSVKKASDAPDIPRHILGPDELSEKAMVVLDRVLETANRRV